MKTSVRRCYRCSAGFHGPHESCTLTAVEASKARAELHARGFAARETSLAPLAPEPPLLLQPKPLPEYVNAILFGRPIGGARVQDVSAGMSPAEHLRRERARKADAAMAYLGICYGYDANGSPTKEPL